MAAKLYPVAAQLAEGYSVIEGMHWSAVELKAAAKGGWARVWCSVCGELAGDCPELAKVAPNSPPEWSYQPDPEQLAYDAEVGNLPYELEEA